MRTLILILPALFMCCGVLWMFTVTLLLANKNGRVQSLRTLFVRMSLVIGVLFGVWGIAIIPAKIVHVGYPLVIMAVGVVLMIQAWAFNKYKFF